MADVKVTHTCVIESMRVLVTSENAKLSLLREGSGDDTRFDALLGQNMESLMTRLKTYSVLLSKFKEALKDYRSSQECQVPNDMRWQFTVTCLRLLEVLVSVLPNKLDCNLRMTTDSAEGEGMLTRDSQNNKVDCISNNTNSTQQSIDDNILLSMGDKKVIATLMQFVICLGVCPNLQAGVGIPVYLRSEFAASIVANTSQVSETEKTQRLKCIANVFMSCVRNSHLSSDVLSRHLSDVLCLLLQLSYGYKSCTNKEQQLMEYNLSSQETEFWQQEVKFLIARIYKPLLVKELLLLQGGPNPKMLKARVANVVLSIVGKKCTEKNLYPSVPSEQLQIPQSVNKSSALSRSPSWLRNCCGRLLTEILLGCHGIHHILQGMLGDDVIGDNTTSVDWRKYDAVAMVIANCPYKASLETYYKNVASQIIALLHKQDSRAWRHHIRVVSGVITHMTTRRYDLAQNYIMTPILRPFLAAIEDADLSRDVIVHGDAIARSIEDIYQIFVLGEMKTDTILSLLYPAIVAMFQMYSFTLEQAVPITYRSWLEAILLAYIKHRDEAVILDFLLTCVTLTHGVIQGTSINREAQFFSANGSVLVKRRDSGSPSDQECESYIPCVMNLLSKLHDSSLVGAFFIHLLKKVQGIVETEVIAANEIQTRVDDGTELSVFRNLSVLNTLSAMCERFESKCLKNTSHIIEFVQVTLERCVCVSQVTRDSELAQFEVETLNMALGLLVAVLSSNRQLAEEEKTHLKRLLPLLENIQSSYHDNDMVDMMNAIRVAIATHGFVLSHDVFKKSTENRMIVDISNQNSSTNSKQTNGTLLDQSDLASANISGTKIIEGTNNLSSYMKSDRIDINENSQTMEHMSTAPSDSANEKLSYEVNAQEESKSHSDQREGNEFGSDMDIAYRKAIEEVNDEFVAVRGHGLIQLTRFIQEKHGDAVKHSQTLLKLFLKHLRDDDSYIYLAAIRGLSALADISPQQVIQRLVTEFVDCETALMTQVTLKLGEVLVKATRNLGDFTPAYKDMLLPAFLHGTKSRDPSIRSSSLSNLGEVCRLLHFSLTNHLNEIVTCCGQLLKTDPDTEVRKAAALVLTLILQGSGTDIIQVLGGTIKDVHRLLQFIKCAEHDDTVLFHVSLALDELNAIMKDVLFPKQELTKKITILGQK